MPASLSGISAGPEFREPDAGKEAGCPSPVQTPRFGVQLESESQPRGARSMAGTQSGQAETLSRHSALQGSQTAKRHSPKARAGSVFCGLFRMVYYENLTRSF